MLKPKPKDTDAVIRWLKVALDSDNPRAPSLAALAKHCQVSPQAVTGWRSTGRISKSHLSLASAFLGSAPIFNAAPLAAQESIGTYAHNAAPNAWPFRAITAAQYAQLPAAAQAQIESFAKFTI